MGKYKGISYLIIGILLMSVAFAVTGTISSFYGESNPFNIDFSEGLIQTYLLNIPIYRYVNNVSLNFVNTPIIRISNGNDILYNYSYRFGLYKGLTNIYNLDGNCNDSIGNYSLTMYGINQTTGVYNLGVDNNGTSFFPNPHSCSARTDNPLALNNWTSGTISFWIKFHSIYVNERFISFDSSATLYWQMFILSTDTSKISVYNSAKATPQFSFSHGMIEDNWYNIVYIWNSTNTTIYINNTMKYNDTENGKFPGSINDIALSFLGSLKYKEFPANASMDEVYIWNRSLASDEVSELYNISYGYFYPFSSPNNITTSLNITKLNNIMSNGNSLYLNFSSNQPTRSEVSLLNASYSYGIDNCSNSFGIPSNATALNLSFKNVDNTSATVNLSTIISYLGTSYYTSAISATHDEYCIYPSWFSADTNTQIAYIDSEGNNYLYYNEIPFSSATYLLPLYVTPGASQTIFTIKDKNTNIVLENVLCTSYIQIGAYYAGAESKLSDITGRIIFNYLPYTNYKFLCSKSGYDTLVFYLLPPSSATYDVPLSLISTINQSFDYDRISIAYSKGPFYNGLNNFTFLIGSLGELNSYGYSLTYPGGSVSLSGTNPNGEQLSTNFMIVGAEITDLVYFDYWYDKVGIGNKTFAPTFAISVPATNYTMIANQGKTYGLGLLERVLVGLLCLIITVGLATLIGQPLMGFGLGLLVLGFLTYIGFFPLWAGIMSFIFGLIFLFSRVEY